MALAFRAAGSDTGRAGDGDFSTPPPLPTGVQIGDLVLLVAWTDSGSLSIANNGGGAWTAVTGSPFGGGTEKLYVWWRLHQMGDSAPTPTASGTTFASSAIAATIAYSSPRTSNPFDVIGTASTGTGTAVSNGGATTTTANALALHIFGIGDNGSASGWTFGGSATGVTERLDVSNTAGNDSQLGAADLLVAAAGPTGTAAATATLSAPWISVTLALAETSVQTLAANHVASTGNLPQPTLAHATPQALSANTVAATGGVHEPSLNTVRNLAANAITSAATVRQPTLTPEPPEQIAANAIGSGATLHQPALTQTPPFTAADQWFRVEITTQHIPDEDGDLATPAEVLYELDDFEDLSVTIPINDARTAEVTISQWHEALDGADLLSHTHYLRIYYRNQPQPVIWGPLRTEDSYLAGKIKLTCVDTLKLQHQYLRIGDFALNDLDDPEVGTLTADYAGVALLLEAAQNTEGQNARGVPFLGIDTGDTGTERGIRFEVQRGQNVWELMQTIASTAGGPDIDLEPRDDVPGIYARLHCYDEQGTNRGRETDPVDGILYTFGAPPEVGADNLRDFRPRKLNPMTHVHVLDDERRNRVTRNDQNSSAEMGAYVGWIQSNINVVDDDITVLEDIAEAHVDAYGRPPDAVELELRPDPVQEWFYGEDFWVGDTVTIYATKAYRGFLNAHMRIVEAQLTQPGKRGPSQTVLSVTPRVARDISTEDA